LWLPLISAMTNGGWSEPMGRPAILIVMRWIPGYEFGC
jgi:hypothetical protein